MDRDTTQMGRTRGRPHRESGRDDRTERLWTVLNGSDVPDTLRAGTIEETRKLSWIRQHRQSGGPAHGCGVALFRPSTR